MCNGANHDSKKVMCTGPNHDLKEIFRSGPLDDIQSVVRWCSDCGAIVVDGELDGRVRPGAVLTMKFPTSYAKR